MEGPEGVQQLSLGFGVASQDAFLAGALPDPSVEGDEPARGWLYRNQCVAVSALSGIYVQKCMGDFRGMRKVDNGELYLKIDSTALLGTAFTTRIDGIVRCLFLLP